MRWVSRIARMGMLKNTYSILFEKPEEMRSLGGRSRRIGEDNIKTYFHEIRRDDVYGFNWLWVGFRDGLLSTR
jgi:hypothetical protein